MRSSKQIFWPNLEILPVGKTGRRILQSYLQKLPSSWKFCPEGKTPSFLQENVDVPVVSVSAKDITLNTLFEMVEANQFLQLPRLSSQDIFDQLCPGMIHRYLRKVYYSSYVSWEKIHMEEQVLVTGTKQSRQGSLPCWPVCFVLCLLLMQYLRSGFYCYHEL